MSASIAHRNAASVLPEPVGAITSAFSPRAMASHASPCTAVGAPKASANHRRTGSENEAMASASSIGKFPYQLLLLSHVH